MRHSVAPDEVVLTLPAAPEFVRLARLTCAGLATRIGMGYDEVEDLRIAVGEACSLLIGGGQRKGTLTLTFGVFPDTVAITIEGDFATDDEPVRSEADGLTRAERRKQAKSGRRRKK